MQNLGPNQRIHQARLSLWPVLEAGTAGWSFTTIRYTQGGRIPEIVVEQSGRMAQQGEVSSWAAIELLYQVSRELTRSHLD